MAGGSHFIWLPVLLSCVFQVSDHRHVPGDVKTENPDVVNILSKLPIIIPEGIDPRNINVTFITVRACTGAVAQLNSQLQQTTVRNKQLDNEAFGLRREVRMLKVQLAACSSTASAITGAYQTQLHSKLKQLLQRLDGDTFLILKTIALTRDVNSLQKRITLASNSTASTTQIGVLQRELQEKTSELNVTMQHIERNTNGLLILQIISLQNQIWDLEQAKSSRGEASFRPDRIILGLQENLNRKIAQLHSTEDASSVMLELISVHSQIKETERLIGVLIEQSKTKAIEYQRQRAQKYDLLKKKILQLNRDENNADLTKEILQLQTEVDHFRQLMLNSKTTTDSLLKELRVHLEVWKKQQGKLQEQLEEADYVQAQQIMNIIAIMKEVRELKVDEQDQTTPTSEGTALQILLQAKEREYAKAQAEIDELQRKLRLRSKFCGTEERYAEAKTEFEQKIAELNRTGDSKAALVLKVINLHDELKTLKKLISTTTDREIISELQRQLEEKQDHLSSTTTDIERLSANPQTILTIIGLQNEIWDLEKQAANETNGERLKELQNRVDGLIAEIDDSESTKLILKIITLQSQVEHLQSQLSEHQTTQLKNDLSTKNEELQKIINDLNEKNPKNATLILRVTDLQKQLKNVEEEKLNAGQKDSATITKLREQLKKIVEEHTHDQAEIKALQNQLNQTGAQCSGFEQKLSELQNDLDAKMKELQAKSDTVTSLALQVSTLSLQLEELKRQLQNTQSETKIKELQKIIDEKTNELAKKSEELKARSTQPQRMLQIIAIQTEIEKLANVATNDTDYIKIEALEEHLKYLIEGIQDEDNENTKLMFKILAQQEEIARLKKQEESQIQADLQKIKVLENELEDIRKQIKEKTNLMGSSDTRISNLTTQISELQKKIKPLEEEIFTLKEENAEKTKELQERLVLSKKQLQDSELRLKEADTKNFNSIMEIADLRAKLKKAQREASKAAKKNIAELEQQIETQQADIEKLEKTNKDLQSRLEQSPVDTNRLEQKLKQLEQQNNNLQNKNSELQRKNNECSGLEQLKTEFEQKIAELNRTGDSKAALVLNFINLHDELKTLKEQISTTDDTDSISALQRQLEKKQEDLNSKTADIERLIANPKTILTIIELQNEIWDLEKQAANETNSERLKELQNRVDGLIAEIDDSESTKLILKMITLQSQVEYLLKQLSEHQKLQTTQTTQLKNDLSTKNEELHKIINDLNEKNPKNATLILRVTDLQKQLKNIEEEKLNAGQKDSATITKLREQLKKIVEEHAHDQAEIKALQNQLNQTQAQCSVFEQKLNELQNDLDAKMKELQSKSDTVTSLALQVSTLSLQLEELKRQLQNTQSETKIKELQKIIDEKTNELAKKSEELKARSTQPQRMLQIIAIQTEIEKLANVATNDTDYETIAALEEHLRFLIDGIQDEDNENTKLMFTILAQQEEIARLKKQEENQIQADLQKIKVLENELEDIRKQIKEKTNLMGSSDTRISNLTTQILELHKKIKPLEEEILTLKEENAKKTKELQERLDLLKKQLQDSELRLKEADTKNFNLIMEIADLRAKLKKAQREASKAAKKNIAELEQQIQTQQAEIEKLEKTNKDLKQEVNELKACDNDVNTQCMDLQNQLDQSQEDANRIEQQLREKEAILQEQLQRLEDLALEHNNLQNEHSNLQNKQHQTQKFADDLKQQLDDKDANLNQLEQELEEQRRENKQLEDNNNSLQNKLKSVEDNVILTERITLDPNTANPRIVLSADNTEISTTTDIQNLPDNPDRFDVTLAVLGKTGWSTGRHYWEVSVAGQRCYHLGMASESSQRKGAIRFRPPFGYWTIILNKQGNYKAANVRDADIQIQRQPLTLGILLDYKKGQISFYDADVRSHMYTFVGQRFTGKIYPFISVCVDGDQTPIQVLTPGSTDWIK